MEANIRRFLPGNGSGMKLVISVISLILFVGVIIYAVYETTKATVTVMVDEEEVTVQTHASTVAELMMEQEWDVNEYDHIEPSLDSRIDGNMLVTWQPAKQVAMTIDGEKQNVWTTAEDVEQLLAEQNIEYNDHDHIEPAVNTVITEDLVVNYESAFQVELTSDGEQQGFWTTSTTVADFLEKENVSLGELDRVEPALEERLDEATDIRVIRVEKVTDVVEETVAFGTVTKRDDDLENGKEKVVNAGAEGQVNKHFEVVLEDGEEISRELVKTETVKESEDRIVAVGTRPAPETVSRSASPKPAPTSTPSPTPASNNSSSSSSESESKSSGGRTMTVSATAYTASCSGCSGVTATGINLNNNRNMKVIAVDPSVIPLGSKVHVEGYGTAVAGDTGGAIKGNKIDVHVPTKEEATRWGRKSVKITILD
ncbi:ubiquitin-like domain-containing protein [Alkalihalophilus lindianensis]|uniref:Ubiquitin-like domain-containing protein n=1 Tax=Alkalihalophilus lindianensis TaxID=1630542 RepID=A0ABU3XFR3_9BACI|nr:ubiquitin-like domain-containing protein [Alkalihalophilus lindianensis]MDV2686742.1 ubiquitin-like domain-containing protein [Alkalihalophilus lindianensis]